MSVVGLIVEYNPLHNGHLYHYQQSLKATGAQGCVAIMSGYFLQRGEPAMIGKWQRAEMALEMGVDLVLELPTAYCTQNAEMFAYGAVSTLHSLGVVDTICFGSESGDISWIYALADYLIEEPAPFQKKLKENLQMGLPYPKAYANTLSSLLGISENAIGQPNNILGLNYVLAIKKLESKIKAATITRTKAGYHQESITDEVVASATAIRKLLAENPIEAIEPYVPKTTLDILRKEKAVGHCPIHWEDFYPYLIHCLATKQIYELADIHEMGEGLEFRLKKKFPYTHSFGELMSAIKTKRYTWNRLQRLLFYILMNVKKSDMTSLNLQAGVPYIRVLGFNQKGRELLHKAKNQASVPIYTKLPKTLPPMLELDLRASTLYQLGSGTGRLNDEYYRSPIIKNNIMPL